MEVAVVLDHSEMEKMWEEQTSFSHHFDFNPFDTVWESHNGWHYESHRIGNSWNEKTGEYGPDVIDLEGIEECDQDDDHFLCTQAILEWIANGLIPDTKLVLINRDW